MRIYSPAPGSQHMNYKETAFTFKDNEQNHRVGIIHNPDQYAGNVGLLIVVGGPQYRIGAHRQYVHLARHCAGLGIPAMRFDYQGTGDSDGVTPGFEHVSADIHNAIDEFLEHVPEVRTVALWGLCEGASALLLGGAEHKATSHIILANPWVRSTSGLARAYVRHYYLDRLKSPDFWRKMFSGRFNIKPALSGFMSNIRKAFTPHSDSGPSLSEEDNSPFPDRMLSGLKDFQGKSLLILSEQDLVAREFNDLITADKEWRDTIRDKISRRLDIAETDHTFSTEKWRMAVAEGTANWLLSEQ